MVIIFYHATEEDGLQYENPYKILQHNFWSFCWNLSTVYVHAVWSYKEQSIRNTSWIFWNIKKQLLVENLGLRNTDILAKIIFWEILVKISIEWLKNKQKNMFEHQIIMTKTYLYAKRFLFFLNLIYQPIF